MSTTQTCSHSYHCFTALTVEGEAVVPHKNIIFIHHSTTPPAELVMCSGGLQVLTALIHSTAAATVLTLRVKL